MGSACLKVTKYFLFLFNLLFFILGAVILGFGVWILADKSSFISVLQTSSSSLKVGACVFVGVGAVTMFMGFLGCIGAIKEVRCLLGLLKQEMGNIVTKLIQNYKDGHEDRLQEAWDYVQAQVKCCGWASFYNWTDNAELRNRTNITYPCSCEDRQEADDGFLVRKGFCEAFDSNRTESGNSPESWPVYREGCMKKVQDWLQENVGIILGVCVGVAVIELLGMLLSICLCRHIHSEDYSKVPKY
ncbi:CD82 antigen isoform X2 [Neomonachus schauinslandi]|uniref:Tetraspanin n=1 Tax=Neomonachus schauinslandi TaxID=29088 RepID=A0A2Y9GRH8_NEOSC|nr:CD82 antigen isoform X2 [Neomonachus schauinslandi]